jgi:hypothetical protein
MNPDSRFYATKLGKEDADDDGSFETAPKDFNAVHWVAIGREEPQAPLVATVFLA